VALKIEKKYIVVKRNKDMKDVNVLNKTRKQLWKLKTSSVLCKKRLYWYGHGGNKIHNNIRDVLGKITLVQPCDHLRREQIITKKVINIYK
jgi:hypothetical protein